MPFVRTAFALLILAALAYPQISWAQDSLAEPAPAHLALLEGEGTLLREGERDQVSSGMPLIPGDVIRTDRGRANILFPDGSALDLDEFTTVEFLSATQLRLTEGRLILTVMGVLNPSEASPFVVDTPAASAQTQGPGEYQVSVLPSTAGQQTELAVVRGNALLITDRGEMPLRAAQHSFAFVDGLPTYPQAFNSGRVDAFENWSAALRAERAGSASARYLPSDLRMYGGAFDRYGSWSYDTSYGNVWYPAVDAGWQPYVDGYWAPLPRYGWTWVGWGAWAWPTHHYGRWGFAGSRWFWIPGRQWGPAWVAWGSAPGYVSWAPLGFNNRAVFGLSVWTGRSAFGWTVVSRDRFVRPGGGWRNGWGGQRILSANPPLRTAFATHDRAPLPAPRLMPRSTTSVPRARTNAPAAAGSAAGGYAVPRNGAGRAAPGSGFGRAPARGPAASGDAARARAGVPRSNGSNAPDNATGARPRERARSLEPGYTQPGSGQRGTLPSAPAPGSGAPRAVPRGAGRTAPYGGPRVAPAPAAPAAPSAPAAPVAPRGQSRAPRLEGTAPPAAPPPSYRGGAVERGGARRSRESAAAPAPPQNSGGAVRRERAAPRASAPPRQQRGGAAAAPQSSGGERARGSARRAR